MVKILLKKIGLLIVCIAILSIVVDALLPYGWADIVQYTKIKNYKNNKDDYNALFFGGSLEYRHIMPSIIDPIVEKDNIKFKSYNFGVDGHNIIQELADIDGIMKIKNDKIKYIFISMSSEPYFFAENKNTSKWLAWVNLKSTYDALTIMPEAGRSLWERARFSMLYVRSYFMNLFKVGMLPDALAFALTTDTLHSAYIGKDKDGFFSYDEERAYLAQFNKGLDAPLIESRASLVNDKAHRDSLLKANTEQFEQFRTADKPNQFQVNMLYRFMKKYNKQGIDVYFILPPRARTTYSYLLPIFNALPESRRIEIADPRQYPAFYKFENGYNFHHLNLKGAKIYSEILGNKISEHLKSNLSIQE